MPTDSDSLADEFLPRWDVASAHATLVRADPVTTFAAIKRADLSRSRVVRLLFWIRGLPTSRLTLASLSGAGFTLLGERPDREIVLGIAGRFWMPDGDLLPITPESFTGALEPEAVKAVWGFRVEPAGSGRTRLRTFTRVQATDAPARRWFRLYWFCVAPFSSLIRRAVLALIRREAEARQGSRRIIARRPVGPVIGGP
jgi:hypothetical protein